MRSYTRGFTLVELVIVIILLGILSAVALPRFLDLSQDAHTATNEATSGALESGVNMVTIKAKTSTPLPTSEANITAVQTSPNGYFLLNTSQKIIGYREGTTLNSGVVDIDTGTDILSMGNANQPSAHLLCARIFNNLLSDSSLKATPFSGTTANPGTVFPVLGTINTPYIAFADGSACVWLNKISSMNYLLLIEYRNGELTKVASAPPPLPPPPPPDDDDDGG